MRRLVALCLAFTLVFVVVPSPALAAATLGYVYLDQQGYRGASCQTNVLSRFSGVDEGYFASVENRTHYNDAHNDNPYIAGEIYEWADSDVLIAGHFYPTVHIMYDEPDSPYNYSTSHPYWAELDDQFYDYFPEVSDGSPATWHRISTVQDNGIWDKYWLYIDGVAKRSYWWPYSTGNIPMTAVEVWKSLTPSDYSFMGRNMDIKVRTSADVWYLQGSSYASQVGWGVAGDNPDGTYQVEINSSYYDFSSRQ